MISRIFAPVKVNLAFDDRVYRLGETIDLTVELAARNKVEVREGSVDLVFEERYTETEILMVPSNANSEGQMRRWLFLRGPGPSQLKPKQVTGKHKASTVHSSVRFMGKQRIYTGAVLRYNPRLQIKREPPPETGADAIIWKLVATLDLFGAPDVTGERTIRLAVE